MLPECFSCFTIVSSEWEQVIGGPQGSGRDLLGGRGGERNLCVCDRERKGGAARERECSVCVNVFACNWISHGQWIE